MKTVKLIGGPGDGSFIQVSEAALIVVIPTIDQPIPAADKELFVEIIGRDDWGLIIRRNTHFSQVRYKITGDTAIYEPQEKSE